jgi:hypothetical protein
MIDGPNMYTYVRQNPWTHFDPEGLTISDVPMAVVQGLHGMGEGFVGAASSFGRAIVSSSQATVNGQLSGAVKTLASAAMSAQGRSAILTAAGQMAGAAAHQFAENAKTPEGFGKNVGAAATLLVGAAAKGGSPTSSARSVSTGEPHGPGYLPESANVVRGGSDTTTGSKPGANSVAGLTTGTKPVPPGTVGAGLTGFSAQSAPGASVADLAKSLPQTQKQIGATTVGQVKGAGGDVVPTPRDYNPQHVTVTGLTPGTANKLLTPTVPKPVIPPPKQNQ